MPEKLRRLLNSHEFFQQAISAYQATMRREDLASLRNDRDRIFNEIVKLTSNEPSITVAQIDFLLASLAELAGDRIEAERLRSWCAEKVRVLSGPLAVQRGGSSSTDAGHRAAEEVEVDPILSPRDTRLLDNISDRAAICDRSYRYLYTNAANATFHGLSPADFIGQQAGSIVGRKIFNRLTTPILGRCFAGESVSLTVAYRSGGKSTTFAARCEPIRDKAGKVVAGMMISRDVSHLAVKPESVWRLPKAARRTV